jgi:hypothetical protein
MFQQKYPTLILSHSDTEIDYDNNDDDITDYNNENNRFYNIYFENNVNNKNILRKSSSLNNLNTKKYKKNKKINYNIYHNDLDYDYKKHIYRLLYNYCIGLIGTHL